MALGFVMNYILDASQVGWINENAIKCCPAARNHRRFCHYIGVQLGGKFKGHKLNQSDIYSFSCSWIILSLHA